MTGSKSVSCQTDKRHRFVTHYDLKLRLTNGIKGQDEHLVSGAYYAVYSRSGERMICDGNLDRNGCARLEHLPRRVRVEFPDLFDVRLLDSHRHIVSPQGDATVDEPLLEPEELAPSQEESDRLVATAVEPDEDDFSDPVALADAHADIDVEDDDEKDEDDAAEFYCEDRAWVSSRADRPADYEADWYSTNSTEVDCGEHEEAHFALMQHVSVELLELDGEPYSGDFVLKDADGATLRRGRYNGSAVEERNVAIGDYTLELDGRTVVVGSDPDPTSRTPVFLDARADETTG